MKKIFLFTLAMLCLFNIGYANFFDNYDQYKDKNEHKECVSKRWNFVCSNSDALWFYDAETAECKNKYNPFGDKVVLLWALKHYRHNLSYLGNPMFNFEINIDKRTYRALNVKDSQLRPIEPDSHLEKLLKIAKKMYESDET